MHGGKFLSNINDVQAQSWGMYVQEEILICFRVTRIKLIKKMLYGIIYVERGKCPRKEGVSLINADKPRKTFVLDTSVLLNSPYAINAFDEHEVVIPRNFEQRLTAGAAKLGQTLRKYSVSWMSSRIIAEGL